MQPIPQRERQREPAPADGPANQLRPVAPSDPELVDENLLAGGTSEPDSTQQDELDWEDDSDSAIGTPYLESSTASLSSSIYESVEEYGRTYHSYKSGKYLLPNDEKEQDRLDLQHAMFKAVTENRLYRAPLHTIPLHNVLDIATGTGIWAIEFAEAHPEANVVGTDLSPIQPQHVPPNCSFEVDDAEDEWLFKRKFSYVHARATVTCFKDFPHIVRSAFRALAPGGFLEFQDPTFPLVFADPQPPPDSPFARWQRLIVEAGVKAGRQWADPRNYKRWFEDAGFEAVAEEKFFISMGAWCEDPRAREIGKWNLANWLEGMEAITPRSMSRLGWSAEESKVLVAQVREEFRKGGLKPYTDYWCVWGRKPLTKTGGDDVAEPA